MSHPKFDFLKEHVFYRELKGQKIDIHRFVGALNGLSNKSFEQMIRQLPSDWETPVVSRIFDHLKTSASTPKSCRTIEMEALMKVAYSFSVLRYVHDPVSAEFVNVGVALYSPEAKYLNAICTPRYGRISKVFEPIEGDHFRQMTRYIESRIEQLGQKMKSGLPFDVPIEDVSKVLAQVLPPDDSALQFSQAGGGFTSATERTLNELYDRYVERYTSRKAAPSRDDEDVWKVYKTPLEKFNLTQYLKPKRIVAPDYDYQFERARKNRVWHAYEPISFDLADSSYIVEKATHWRGRMTNLADSDEKFKLHILLGQPHESKLREAFGKAKNILHRIPGKPEIVEESEAEQFAAELKKEIDEHGA